MIRNQHSSRYARPLFFFLLLLFGGAHIGAQTPTPTPSPTAQHERVANLERQFFKNILRDQKAIWTSPFHLQRSDARWLAPLAVGTGALIATDRTTAKGIAKFDDQLQASRIVSYPGATYGAAGVGALFYFVGRARNNLRARETGLLSWEALIDSELVVVPLKQAFQRRRPLAVRHRGSFFQVGTSFPSGHAIHAWSVATVIAHEYSDHRLVQVVAYGLATAVAIARFTGEKHFLSDVLVGGAMGYGIGRYVYKTRHVKLTAAGSEEEESTFNRRRKWPLFVPHFNPQTRDYGAQVLWSF